MPHPNPSATVAVTVTSTAAEPSPKSAGATTYVTPVGVVAGVTDGAVTSPPTHVAGSTCGLCGTTGVHDAASNVTGRVATVGGRIPRHPRHQATDQPTPTRPHQPANVAVTVTV